MFIVLVIFDRYRSSFDRYRRIIEISMQFLFPPISYRFRFRQNSLEVKVVEPFFVRFRSFLVLYATLASQLL
jgi:hypothetical protein